MSPTVTVSIIVLAAGQVALAGAGFALYAWLRRITSLKLVSYENAPWRDKPAEKPREIYR